MENIVSARRLRKSMLKDINGKVNFGDIGISDVTIKKKIKEHENDSFFDAEESYEERKKMGNFKKKFFIKFFISINIIFLCLICKLIFKEQVLNNKYIMYIINEYNKDYTKAGILEKIENKTEAFSPSKIMKIDFACVIFNNDIALALKMNKEGKVIGRSKLLFEESDDLVFSGMDLKEECIEYKINSKIEYNPICTRKEFNIINNLCKYINSIYKDNCYDELKFIYLECFNHEELDMEKIYDKLINSLSNVNFNVINKLTSLVKTVKK